MEEGAEDTGTGSRALKAPQKSVRHPGHPQGFGVQAILWQSVQVWQEREGLLSAALDCQAISGGPQPHNALGLKVETKISASVSGTQPPLSLLPPPRNTALPQPSTASQLGLQ